METIYTTLQGESLDLKKLNKEQKELLRRFYGLHKSGQKFADFFNEISSCDSLKIMGAPCLNGQYRIDSKVLYSVIYSVLQDLGNRLAKQQIFFKQYPNRYDDFTENAKMLEEFLSQSPQ